jgi:hypothetical protein
MATDENDHPDATSLRERAALARRLALGLSHGADRHKLSEVADQFEADAAKLEKVPG